MASVSAERGYVETRVDDVIAAAGVSRRTFYQYFADRQDCFLAVYEVICDDVIALFEPRDEDPPGERLQASLERGLGQFAAWPRHAQVMLTEINSLGPVGVDLHERTMDQLGQLLADCDGWDSPEWAWLEPGERAQAIIGAIHRVISRRLARGRHQALPDLAAGLRAIAAGS